MCDFSLQSVRSRPAQVGDKLVTQDFGTGTRGFAAADDRGLAVCVLPGTELAFAGDVATGCDVSDGLVPPPQPVMASATMAANANEKNLIFIASDSLLRKAK